MRKRWALWIAVGTMLVVGVAAGGQQGRWAAQNDATAQSLVNMERQWAEADCDGNLALQTFLADDFQGTAPDGSRYSKAQEVQDTKTSKHESHDCRLGETKVHFFGDNLAVLYGTESRIQKESDGSERTRSLIWTDTWLKRNARWQIIAAQDMWVPTK
jgi:ketosteroid isomerase-like protein